MEKVLFYNSICLFLTLLILLYCFRIYGIKAIINPFFIFLVTWVPTFVAVPLFALVNDAVFIPYPDYAIELFQFYIFNVVVIFISLIVIKVNLKSTITGLNIKISDKLYNRIALVIFVTTLFQIATRGFDVVSNREMLVNEAMTIMETGNASFMTSLLSIIQSPTIILVVLSAKDILFKLVYGTKFKLSIYKVLPLISIFLQTISLGGRSTLFHTLILLIMSIILCYNYQKPLKKLILKSCVLFLIVFIPINIYSTFVSSARSEAQGSEKNYIIKNDNLQFLDGLVEYSFWHVLGYQYRRNDAFSEEPNGLRGNTWGFIKNISIPFASQFGAKSNLGAMFGIAEPPQYNYTILPGITATIYYNLYSDLGYYGALLAIIIFTVLSQLLFKRFVVRPVDNLFLLGLYIYVYGLWRSSWFSHLVGGINLVGVFMPYIIVWTLMKFNPKKNIIK